MRKARSSLTHQLADAPTEANPPTAQGHIPMSDTNNSNSSFTHAFLPGLILGIIIGAVAATFIPVATGPKIPTATGSHTPHADGPRDHGADQTGDEDLQDLIDEAQEQLDDTVDDASGAIDDAVEDLQEDLPTTPPSDG